MCIPTTRWPVPRGWVGFTFVSHSASQGPTMRLGGPRGLVLQHLTGKPIGHLRALSLSLDRESVSFPDVWVASRADLSQQVWVGGAGGGRSGDLGAGTLPGPESRWGHTQAGHTAPDI